MNPPLTGLTQIAHYSFLITMFAGLGAAIFFALERGKVGVRYRTALSLWCVASALTGIGYHMLKDCFVAAVVGGERFPAEFRAAGAAVVLPVMLAQFPALLGVGPRGRKFIAVLTAIALEMAVGIYLAEASLRVAGVALEVVAWVAITTLLAFALSDLPPQADAQCVRRLGWWVVIGWIGYPICSSLAFINVGTDVRVIANNFVELFNVLVPGLTVYAAGCSARRAEGSQASEIGTYEEKVPTRV